MILPELRTSTALWRFDIRQSCTTGFVVKPRSGIRPASKTHYRDMDSTACDDLQIVLLEIGEAPLPEESGTNNA